jgi:hypothetical protein
VVKPAWEGESGPNAGAAQAVGLLQQEALATLDAPFGVLEPEALAVGLEDMNAMVQAGEHGLGARLPPSKSRLMGKRDQIVVRFSPGE